MFQYIQINKSNLKYKETKEQKTAHVHVTRIRKDFWQNQTLFHNKCSRKGRGKWAYLSIAETKGREAQSIIIQVNNQETTKISVNWRMSKENVEYLQIGVLLDS